MWLEASASIGDQAVTNLKLTKHLSLDSFLTINTSINSFRRLPSTSVVFGKQLSPNTTGYISYRPDWKKIWGLGGKSTCSIGMNYKDDKVVYGIDLQASSTASTLSLRQTRNVFDGIFKIRTEASLGNRTGLGFVLGADQKINDITRAGAAVECASLSGVTLRLK